MSKSNAFLDAGIDPCRRPLATQTNTKSWSTFMILRLGFSTEEFEDDE